MSRQHSNGDDLSLIERVAEAAEALRSTLPASAMTITAVWTTEYAARIRPASSSLHLKHICVQTDHIGSCYFELTSRKQPSVSEVLLGRNVFDLPLTPIYVRIAALDAVLASARPSPAETHAVSGNAAERTRRRAEIVVGEVLRLASLRRQGGAALRVVNVGVVGDFLEILSKQSDIALHATDFYDGIRGTTIYGTKVLDGGKTLKEIELADIALVTGMTLATETLDDIVSVARQHGTLLVLFAETGANFAGVYLDNGIDVVISEPFPFYLSGSEVCHVYVHRANS